MHMSVQHAQPVVLFCLFHHACVTPNKSPPSLVAPVQYEFTAKPLGGGNSVISLVTSPLAGRFRGLQPSTQ